MGVYKSLSEFIDDLDKEGELIRIREPVSPNLEIPAISDLMMKEKGGGKAILFENVAGYSMPVLVNAYGSKKRMSMALNGDPTETGKRIEELIKTAPPTSLAGALSLLPRLKRLRGAIPKKLKTKYPPCREVVHTGEAADLSKIPVLTCWPDDGGPFVTFPCVITKDPVTGRQNVGMYRLQIYDKHTTGMHWHIHKDGSAAYDAHKRLHKRMEVAVAIGTDPAITYAATAPLPRGIDEMMFAGFLRGQPVELVKGVTVDVWVPANSEIVLEGYVELAEERIEGPFGDHTGYYSPADPYPVFHITAITHKMKPVYFATVVGIPPMEDEWIGWATERLFLPLLNTNWPEVTDMHLPPQGVFHNLCIASMQKLYPLQAKRLISGFWGAGQMSFTKIILVLDEDENPSDHLEVLRTALNRVSIPESLVIAEGVLDALDHSSPNALWGGKLGIDATSPIPGEPGYGEPARKKEQFLGEEEIFARLKSRAPGLVKCVVPVKDARLTLLVNVIEKSRPFEGMELSTEAIKLPGVDIAVAVEGTAHDSMQVLAWRILASIDPKRDIRIILGKLAVDATTKTPEEGHPREWPKEVAHPPEVVAKARELLGRYYR